MFVGFGLGLLIVVVIVWGELVEELFVLIVLFGFVIFELISGVWLGLFVVVMMVVVI